MDMSRKVDASDKDSLQVGVEPVLQARQRAAVALAVSSALLALTSACASNQPPAEHPAPPPSSQHTARVISSSMPELKKLNEYHNVLDRKLPDTLMIFTGMPGSKREADQMAPDMAARLIEFARVGVKPLVIMEPQIEGWSKNAGTKAISTGKYDQAMTQYFKDLRQAGVASDAIGTWVFMPEANTSAWDGVTTPELVGRAVAHSAKSFKQVYPTGRASLMLDSETYKNGDTEWVSGKRKSLVPYAAGIPAGLIDTVGLQGFPWAPSGGSAEDVVSPHEVVDHRLVDSLAKTIGAQAVWYNTGTFKAIHTDDQPVYIKPQDRSQFLAGVLDEAVQSKHDGFDTTVVIFAQDKSTMSEATDWHYTGAADQDVLKHFIQDAHKSDIRFGLFDS